MLLVLPFEVTIVLVIVAVAAAAALVEGIGELGVGEAVVVVAEIGRASCRERV